MSGLLGNRWLAGAVAWAAIAMAIWNVGATLASPAMRLSLILLAGATWLALEMLRSREMRRTGEELFAALARGADASAAGEAGELRAGFEKAAALASQTVFRGPDGKACGPHELPWFVFIGAPGSGKTTALVNGGLRFPLAGAASVRPVPGVGGTRNCDWWFTEQAVLLDTAGRYTTQDSDRKADAAAWFEFLGLLRQFRPQLPLNGVLVSVSASDLMLWTKEERSRYAAHVRMRLTELHAAIGARVPVYVLVTKMDLVAGFLEFFDALDIAGRSQVWGMTFEAGGEPAPEQVAASFEREFAALEQRLYSEMIDRLTEERDLQRRASIYRFPQQFRALGPMLGELLGLAFCYRHNHQAPMLRGIYFTSGTQEGSPIDRVLGAIARNFGIARDAVAAPGGSGRSYFVERLLHEVVFAEAGLGATSAARQASVAALPADAFPPAA